MQVTKEQVEPCTVALDVQIEPETVDRAFDRAYREFGNFTNVPGFRPGKAPRKMLERYVNQERLRERVMELIAAPAYREALQQESITPYRDPEVEFSDLAQGQPWQFKAKVPTAPSVTLGDYSNIEVERPVYTVTDEDVNRQVESLRGEYARLEKVEDRGVEPDDILIAETTITPEGEEPSAEPRRSLIRMGDNVPGFDEAVMGMKPDEERTFTLTYPPDYQDAELAGKPAEFKVKLVSINKRVLPDLTDEWVANVTSFQSIDALKDNIRERSEQSLKDLSDRVAESRIVDELVKRAQIDFPSVLVQEEVESDLHELEHELENRRVSYEQYLQMSGKTEEQHQAELAQKAEARVRSLLVLRELAKQESIDVTDAEIDAEFDRLAETQEIAEGDLDRLRGQDRSRQRVANMVIQRKLRDYLFSHAKIKDVPAKRE